MFHNYLYIANKTKKNCLLEYEIREIIFFFAAKNQYKCGQFLAKYTSYFYSSIVILNIFEYCVEKNQIEINPNQSCSNNLLKSAA